MPEARTDGFEAATASYRRELLAHCYRMTGSVHEAEDLVQETYVRAWRAYDRFEQRSSVRTWLYRIATNVCLTALDRRRRRPPPSGLAPPSPDPNAPAELAPGDLPWLEPVPDRLVIDERGDPAEVVAARHSVRLALIAGMQNLPARQRAAFILCGLLAHDVVLEMTGTTTWFSGKTTCVPFIATQAIGRAGDWQMAPILANGQLAAAAYHRANDGAYHPFAIVVLATTSTEITRISLFADPRLFPHFQLPPSLPAGR